MSLVGSLPRDRDQLWPHRLTDHGITSTLPFHLILPREKKVTNVSYSKSLVLKSLWTVRLFLVVYVVLDLLHFALSVPFLNFQ